MSGIVVLYVVGALLELAGISLIGLDVLDSSRTLADMSTPDWLNRQTEEDQARPGGLFGLMAAVAAGKIRRRAFGVALIASGLVVQTAGNIAAL